MGDKSAYVQSLRIANRTQTSFETLICLFKSAMQTGKVKAMARQLTSRPASLSTICALRRRCRELKEGGGWLLRRLVAVRPKTVASRLLTVPLAYTHQGRMTLSAVIQYDAEHKKNIV